MEKELGANKGIQVIRIFVSSPGDMNVERDLVMSICRRVQGQFSAYFKIEPYYWENAPMYASKDYQECIEPPENFDLYLGMLWSRLGTRLHPGRHHRKDGSTYNSGTEFEFENALNAYFASNRSRPELIVYHRVTVPNIPLEPKEEHDRRYRQYQLVKQFIDKWTRDPEDNDMFRAAINTYKTVDEFELHFENALQEFLKRKLPENAVLRPEVSWIEGSPFRGLNYFDFKHSSIFYGRTKAIYEILQSMEVQYNKGVPFVLVNGSSGVGKSSLVRAGLLPQLLRPNERFKTAIWRYAEFRPSDLHLEEGDIYEMLIRALIQDRQPTIKSKFSAQALPSFPPALPEMCKDQDVEFLVRQFRENNENAVALIDNALNRISLEAKEARHEDTAPKARLCLLVDQIEEFFTLSWITSEAREKFFSLIHALVKSGHVFVVATMRSDFISCCEHLPDLMELKKDNGYYHVEPPSPYELGRIIRLPAQTAGLIFEKRDDDVGLDEVLHEAMRQEAGTTALPLLEFTLQALYELAQNNKDEQKRYILSFSDYETLGGLEGSIARKSEETFLSLSPAGKEAFEKIMPHLAQLTGESFTRIPASREVLEKIEGGNEFVDAFIGNRLLTATTHESGVVVSLVHEAILLHWDRLCTWLENRRAHFQIRERLRNSAQLWKNACQLHPEQDHDDLLLAPGTPLNDGKVFLEEHPEELSKDVCDFISKSIEKDKQREQRRIRILRRWIAALSILVLVASAFGIAFWRTSLSEAQAKIRADNARDQAENVLDHIVYTMSDQLKPIGRLDIAETAINRALQYYEEMANDTDMDARQKLRYASALDTKARLVFQRSDYDLALQAYEKSISLLRELTESNPDNLEWQYNLSLAFDHIGYLYGQMGQFEKEREACQRAFAIVSELAKREPNKIPWQIRLSVLLDAIAATYQREGQQTKALELHKEALAISRKLSELFPNDGNISQNLARSLDSMGDFYKDEGQMEQALGVYQEALSLNGIDVNKYLSGFGGLSRIGSFMNEQTAEFEALMRMGDIYKALKDYDKAYKLYEAAFNVMIVQAQRDMENPSYAQKYAFALSKLADVSLAQNKFEEALQQAEKSVDFLRNLSSEAANVDWKRDFASALELLGKLYIKQNEMDKALSAYQEAIAVRQMVAETDPGNMKSSAELAAGYEQLGNAYKKAGKLDEAKVFYQASLDQFRMLSKRVPSYPLYLRGQAVSLASLASLETTQPSESAALMDEAISILEMLLEHQPGNDELKTLLEKDRSIRQHL